VAPWRRSDVVDSDRLSVCEPALSCHNPRLLRNALQDDKPRNAIRLYVAAISSMAVPTTMSWPLSHLGQYALRFLDGYSSSLASIVGALGRSWAAPGPQREW